MTRSHKPATTSSRRLDVVHQEPFPAYVVWELTLRCDHACTHCGSRAGSSRPDELGVDEALEVVEQLRALKTREVVLIGGEAYLHPGFLEIVRALKNAGIRPAMTTGGRGVTRELAFAMQSAGMQRVSVSIDGMEEAHDRMRHLRGSFRTATSALGHLKEAGISASANTNLNRSNQHDLEPLYEHLLTQGVSDWQLQLTTPLGRAADRSQMVLQPWDLLDLVPRIAALKERGFRDGIRIQPGNNLGYFGPEETLLRSPGAGGTDHFQGCQAGRFVMGIESDGAVKGCPSLQTQHYVGGTVRSRTVREIWDDAPELALRRKSGSDHLWGFCSTCPFASTCKGGCTFTAHALLGRPGNNPYCHFRARDFARRGLRERLVSVEEAPGRPFDNGRFEIVTEALDAPDPDAATAKEELVQLRRPAPAP